MHKRGISQFSVGVFLSHRYKKTSLRNHSVFEKVFGIDKFSRIRGGGYYDFPSRFFFGSYGQKTSYGNPSVFQKTSGDEKFYGEEGGGVSRF